MFKFLERLFGRKQKTIDHSSETGSNEQKQENALGQQSSGKNEHESAQKEYQQSESPAVHEKPNQDSVSHPEQKLSDQPKQNAFTQRSDQQSKSPAAYERQKQDSVLHAEPKQPDPPKKNESQRSYQQSMRTNAYVSQKHDAKDGTGLPEQKRVVNPSDNRAEVSQSAQNAVPKARQRTYTRPVSPQKQKQSIESASSHKPFIQSEHSADFDLPRKQSIAKNAGAHQVEQKDSSEKRTEIPSSTRRAIAPRTQRNADNTLGRRTRKTSVYIGLDFGTTFTKAAYEIAPSNVHTKYSIKFRDDDSPNDYYLPSVLYFDPNTDKLSVFNTTGNLEEIRYFKYNLISDALQKNKVINDPRIVTRTSKEQLCCTFFLSYVIYLIRNAVNSNFGQTVLDENSSWYINMGVPLEARKEDERALLYKKVLEIAYQFEAKFHGRTEIDIHELDDFFVEHREESNPNINILPEIYAEVLLYQQYLNTPAGFYTVVDIGGGTEDIATFLKMTDEFEEKVECLAQNVISYGYDSVSEKIVKSINEDSIQKAKNFLSDEEIDFNDNRALLDHAPGEINYEMLLEARKHCRTLFGKCVQRARKTREDILEQTVSARLPMHVFVMGGAQNVAFYRASIEHMKKAQESAGIPFFKDADIFDYVGRNTRLEIRNDQRLVISQMLAQPYEMIPEIDKMPWDLKEHDVTSKGLTWMDLYERQNELYPV